MLMYQSRNGLRGVSFGRYGEMTVSDWGSGVGTAIGAGLRTFFPGLSTEGNQPSSNEPLVAYQSGYSEPSWWSQQTTGTKVLIGGAAFLIGAAGLVALRAKLKK